jgi:hypothetical protein
MHEEAMTRIPAEMLPEIYKVAGMVAAGIVGVQPYVDASRTDVIVGNAVEIALRLFVQLSDRVK